MELQPASFQISLEKISAKNFLPSLKNVMNLVHDVTLSLKKNKFGKGFSVLKIPIILK